VGAPVGSHEGTPRPHEVVRMGASQAGPRGLAWWTDLQGRVVHCGCDKCLTSNVKEKYTNSARSHQE
jgi:hypothetical protein